MISLPDFLTPFQTQAIRFLKEGKVRDVEFAGGTYQIQVIDDKEEWAFIQLDSRGYIKDCFCSCESPEAKPACVHLASAFLRIYQGTKDPLHRRFRHSLWNALLRVYADRIGIHPDSLHSDGKGNYSYVDENRVLICLIKGKSEDAIHRLKEMIDERKLETEETSLKFSNLSPDEIASWKEGRPGSRLRYELSYWNDLAKWLMLSQDGKEPYTITFDQKAGELPHWITLSFPEIEIGFHLFEEELPTIIPSLSTVNAPLRVHHVQYEMIEKITYDKQAGCLKITPREGEHFPKKEGITLKGWQYVEGDGFYPMQSHALVEKASWCQEEINEALDNYAAVIKPLLKEEIYATSPVKVSYYVAFDPEWNLHVTGYVEEIGDLTKEGSADFGHWIYLDEKGFFPVEIRRFDKSQFVIPADEVADFVREYRGWLNSKEGFHTHLMGIESRISYRVSSDHTLSFNKEMVVSDTDEAKPPISKDFGTVIYVEERGFYPKSSSQIVSPINPKSKIKADQIANFIRANRDELQAVPNFFKEQCPVGHSGLHVELTSDETVKIEPSYSLYPEYRDREVCFFDEFVFVPGEGFFELPAELRLPERFRSNLELEPENLANFLSFELESLKKYASYIDHRLLKQEDLVLAVDEMMRDFKRGKEWYRLKMHYRSSTGSVSVVGLLLAKKKRVRFFFSDAGLIDFEDSKFNWLKNIDETRFDVLEDKISLTALELIKLNVLDAIQVLDPHNLIQELTEFHIPEPPNLKGMKSKLRPYQHLGVEWLWFLYNHGLSGLLCDDMGLGKTHQSMALIAAIKNASTEPVHVLIVCPTSVLYHWEEKLKQFLPKAKVCTFYGTQRSLKSYDILLTSYGVWRNEKDLLCQIPFELAIFDEVQIAKNHNSRIHHALSTVKASMRLGLTGTPVENYLRELKALFDLVIPGYMPNHADYRRIFIRPIEKEEDPEKKQLLKRFINPFILRRKKEDVLIDLPPKTEEIYLCDLAVDQKMLYLDVLDKSKRHLIDELQNEKAPIPYIHIFAILTHLKQICDHPAVYLKESENYTQYQSGKWDLFLELLHEALDSQQKVVVYSQYLGMLDIIENHLKEEGIEYAAIRGATRKRGEEMIRFNQDKNCKVFVGSLQAAGLGIDLTAASVVIHYDRWWNAAKENQATDRIHRIGQVRGVQVYKLVTKGTFEERIDAMIRRKGKLMEDIIGLDDHQLLKSFNRDELLELLQYLEEDQ